MLVRFDFQEQRYDFEAEQLSVFEARLLKALTGMTAGAFLGGLAGMDGDSIAGMIYLAKRRAGEDIEWSSLDEVDLMPIIKSIGDLRIEDDVDEAVRHFEGGPQGLSKAPKTTDSDASEQRSEVA